MRVPAKVLTTTIFAAALISNALWAYKYGELTSIADGWREQAVKYAQTIMDKNATIADQRNALADLRKQLNKRKAVLPNPKGVHIPHLQRTITATLAHLRVPKYSLNDWQRLMLLTIVQESNAGAYTRQLKGPARGMVQIEPETEHTVLAWLRSKKPDLYSRVRSLRVPAHLDIHEAEYNTAYAIGIAYSLYVMRHVDPKGKSAIALAHIYKDKYNTSAGKATVDGVMQRLQQYAVNL